MLTQKANGRATLPLLPTVFILDEDVAARESLASLVRSMACHVECFATAEDFLARPRTMTHGCLILDVSLPQLDGLALQEHIAERTETPLIFITAHRDIGTIVRAIKAGAVDFLMKPFNTVAVSSAVRCALERSRCALAQAATLRTLEDRYASLSPREREVLELVVTGLLNKQIGAELGISEITVKAHRGKMMRKMAAASLAHLVNIAAHLRLEQHRSIEPRPMLAVIQ